METWIKGFGAAGEAVLQTMGRDPELLLLLLLHHVLGAYALMTMARRAQHPYAAVAWIPYVGHLYIMGELLKEELKGRGGWKVLVPNLIGIGILGGTEFVPLYGITALMLIVMMMYIHFWLFDKYTRRPLLHLLLSVVPLYTALIWYLMRNQEPKNPQFKTNQVDA